MQRTDQVRAKMHFSSLQNRRQNHLRLRRFVVAPPHALGTFEIQIEGSPVRLGLEITFTQKPNVKGKSQSRRSSFTVSTCELASR